MSNNYKFISMTPVLPSPNVKKDIEWHKKTYKVYL